MGENKQEILFMNDIAEAVLRSVNIVTSQKVPL